MFAEILGNEPIKTYLSRALKQGLHHTLLFSGLDGIGKSLFAKALAKELLGADEARIREENHPDLHILRPEGKSGTHPIEQLREFINEVHKPPFLSSRKVFILSDVERMLPSSANALLKTLEEPSLDCTIILLTSAPHEILPTILSRCVQIAFQPLSVDLIASQLQQQIPSDKAAQIARLSNGSLGRALQLLQDRPVEKAQRHLFDALEGKIPNFQAIEQIETLFDDLEGLAFHQAVEELLAAYLMLSRDRELRLSGGNEQWLYFPQEAGSLPLSRAEKKVADVKFALERNVRLSACLDHLFS